MKMLSLLDAHIGSLHSDEEERRDMEDLLRTLFVYGVNVDAPSPGNYTTSNSSVIECL